MTSFAEKLDNYLIRFLADLNYKSFANRLDLQGNEQILEVGSGGGNLSRFLAKKIPNGRLVCLDKSEYWINKSKKRLKDLRNIKYDLESILDFDKKNYFDIAVVHYVLHDIMEMEKVVNVLNKSLKDNGLIYVREPTRKSHGMPSTEIEYLMFSAGLEKLSSREGYSFPLRGKVYEGVFIKTAPIK